MPYANAFIGAVATSVAKTSKQKERLSGSAGGTVSLPLFPN